MFPSGANLLVCVLADWTEDGGNQLVVHGNRHKAKSRNILDFYYEAFHAINVVDISESAREQCFARKTVLQILCRGTLQAGGVPLLESCLRRRVISSLRLWSRQLSNYHCSTSIDEMVTSISSINSSIELHRFAIAMTTLLYHERRQMTVAFQQAWSIDSSSRECCDLILLMREDGSADKNLPHEFTSPISIIRSSSVCPFGGHLHPAMQLCNCRTRNRIPNWSLKPAINRPEGTTKYGYTYTCHACRTKLSFWVSEMRRFMPEQADGTHYTISCWPNLAFTSDYSDT